MKNRVFRNDLTMSQRVSFPPGGSNSSKRSRVTREPTIPRLPGISRVRGN